MAVRLRHLVGELLVGTLEVTAEIGSGAFGTVYRCRDRRGGPDRAVKEMAIAGDEVALASALRYFEREAGHLARFDHAGIPRAEAIDVEGPFWVDPATGLEVAAGTPDAIEIAVRHYLVMEWVDGVSLENLVRATYGRGQTLQRRSVLAWCRQVASALDYVHQRGLVHGDVKPHNILIRRDDSSALLIDFGLCRPSAEPDGYGTVPLNPSGRLGTPGYAPPDPVEQEHPLPASDLHALAMTVRRALTGLDPTDPAALLRLRSERLCHLRDDLAEHEGAALDRAIATDWRDRPESVAALVALLDAPPIPAARPVRVSWIELRPPELDAGTVARGGVYDLDLIIRDRRPGQKPTGTAESKDPVLRILPATAHGNDVALHLMLRIPYNAPSGPAQTRLVVRANDEEHQVAVRYTVDLDARPPATPVGCLALPVAALSWRV